MCNTLSPLSLDNHNYNRTITHFILFWYSINLLFFLPLRPNSFLFPYINYEFIMLKRHSSIYTVWCRKNAPSSWYSWLQSITGRFNDFLFDPRLHKTTINISYQTDQTDSVSNTFFNLSQINTRLWIQRMKSMRICLYKLIKD